MLWIPPSASHSSVVSPAGATWRKSARALDHLLVSKIFLWGEKNQSICCTSCYAICYLDIIPLICWKHLSTDSFLNVVFTAIQLMSSQPPYVSLTIAISPAGPSEGITWPQQNYCVKEISLTLWSAQLDGLALLSFADLESVNASSQQWCSWVLAGMCLHLPRASFSGG